MTWLVVLALAVAAFLAIALPFKPLPAARTAAGAALLFGLAGYATQAHPDLAGAPAAPRREASDEAAAMVEARRDMARNRAPADNNWLVIGDALARHGRFADAATVYRGAVEKNPRDGEAWLALANALVAHADGNLTPAALLAYRRASAAAPDDPGAPLFLGMALARSERSEEAREVWGDLLARSPPDAPWRAELGRQVQALDALVQGGPIEGRRER